MRTFNGPIRISIVLYHIEKLEITITHLGQLIFNIYVIAYDVNFAKIHMETEDRESRDPQKATRSLSNFILKGKKQNAIKTVYKIVEK